MRPTRVPQFSTRFLLLVVGVFSAFFAALLAAGLFGVWVLIWVSAFASLVASFRSRKFIAVMVILLFVAIAGYPFVVMEGHPVPLSKLSRIHNGMGPLGEPTTRTTFDDGQMSWRYHGMTWCMIEIVFSDDGRVSEIIHDH